MPGNTECTGRTDGGCQAGSTRYSAPARVVALATLIGFDAVDCGGLQAARYLEPFAMTWIHMAIKLGHGRSFAFARLRR